MLEPGDEFGGYRVERLLGAGAMGVVYAATQLSLDAKGRLLVGGGITSPQLPSGGGFAMARYLTGR